ncbi:MAG: tRNA lysidine(34) synthetase TilS [Chrysiogenales bacterium]|nr:MAG: tRNA lysidine(34) synthetase TilS [Chrysiogenales bacterium]
MLMNQLIDRIAAYIRLKGLIKKNDRVLVSMSAGKDSIFLFNVLLALGETEGFYLGLFHLNHMARGEESDSDEEHLARLAEEHGVEIFIKRSAVENGPSFEERARNIRYEILTETARKHGYGVIATAHTMDDNIETVLMRVFSGTGVYGLIGIPPRRGNIVRPLLEISSEEIYGFLRERGIPWREDETNRDVSYSRNFIRQQLIPTITGRFPMAREAILSLSATASEVIGLLDDLVMQSYPVVVERSGNDMWIYLGTIIHDRALFNHVVSSSIRSQSGARVSRSMLDEVYHKYQAHRSNIMLYRDAQIRIDKAVLGGNAGLRIRGRKDEKAIIAEWCYMVDMRDFREATVEIVETGMTIIMKMVDFAFFERNRENSRYAFVTLDERIESLYIRNRRKGDSIRSSHATKKIKNILIEMKLDGTAKNRIPILACRETVVALLAGFEHGVSNRISRDFLVDKKSRNILVVFKDCEAGPG